MDSGLITGAMNARYARMTMLHLRTVHSLTGGGGSGDDLSIDNSDLYHNEKPESNKLWNIKDPISDGKIISDAPSPAKTVSYLADAALKASAGKGAGAVGTAIASATGIKVTGVSPNAWRDAYGGGKALVQTVQNVGKEVPPVKGLGGKLTKGTFSAARIAIGIIDAVCGALNLPNPIDEFLRKPFAGDWDAMQTTAAQWKQIAAELEQIRSALQQTQNEAQQFWEGKVADAYALRNQQAQQVLSVAPSACNEIADGLNMVAQYSSKCFDTLLDVIDEIISICTDLAEYAATGPIGLAALAIKHGASIYYLYQNATEIINAMLSAIDSFEAVSKAIEAPLAQAQDLKGRLGK